MDPRWLDWVKRLQAIAQTGLTFAKDPYDLGRYESVKFIAAEILASKEEGQSVGSIVRLFSSDVGYATPKVDVRAAVFRDGRILLVREKEDGRWTLPGGWADVGDSPSGAVVREVKEESGYDVKVRKLLALLDRNLHGHPPIAAHAYKLFFQCDLVGGDARAEGETDAVDFFPKDKIPPLSLTRVTGAQIEQLFEHFSHPDWPTQFD